MKGAKPKKHFTVSTSSGEAVDPKYAIFPIFLVKGKNYKFLGTGFFITKNGWFVSAKHVFDEAGLSSDNCGLEIIQFSAGNKYYRRPVLGYAPHPKADVAVGICANMTHNQTGEFLWNKVLTLSRRPIEIGETVWTFAYPDTKVTYDAGYSVAVNPLYFVGDVTDAFPSGRDSVLLPGTCLQTSIVIHGGSSGGPVFASPGHVIGINSTGFDDDELSFISWIGDIEPLKVKNVWIPEENAARSLSIRELIACGRVAFHDGI